jgi:hypothetical protein
MIVTEELNFTRPLFKWAYHGSRSRPLRLALVVDLGGRDVAVAEQVLHLADVHAGASRSRISEMPTEVRCQGPSPSRDVEQFSGTRVPESSAL